MVELQYLADHGLTATADGDVLRVRPSGAITNGLGNYIRVNKSALLSQSRWAPLRAAINAHCDKAGLDDGHRKALIDACWQEPASDWPWWTDYFRSGLSAR